MKLSWKLLTFSTLSIAAILHLTEPARLVEPVVFGETHTRGDFAKAKVDGAELIAALMKQQAIPGFSIAVAVNGKTEWSEGFGVADLENKFTSQRTTDGKETGVGLGWRIGIDELGRRILHHGGNSVGARAFILMYPDQRVVVVMLSNLTFARFAEQDAAKVAELFIN